MESPADISPFPIVNLQDAGPNMPGIDVQLLVKESYPIRPAPQFIYGPCDPDYLRHFHNDQYSPPIFLIRCRDMEVVGPWFMTGAILKQGETYFSSSCIASDPNTEESRRRIAEHETALRDGSRTVRYVPGQVLLLPTNGHQIYGHWLADFLPKLYLLELAGIDIDTLKIAMPTNMGGFGLSFLRLLGIKEENIVHYDPDKESFCADELVIPGVLRWGGRCSILFSDAIAYLNERIDRFNSVPVISNQRRVFLSRSQSGRVGRPMANEDRIEQMASEAGFTLVYPEAHPLLTQIGMLRGARRLIGQYGSALHGTIFSRPGIIVCGLHGQLPATFDALQSGIGERLGQPTGYVFGQSIEDNPYGMLVDENDFGNCLREQFA